MLQNGFYLHIGTNNEGVNDQKGDSKVPEEAEGTLAVEEVPLDLGALVLALDLRVLVVVNLINNLVHDQLVKLSLLTGLLSELFVVLPGQIPKVSDAIRRYLLLRLIVAAPVLFDVHLYLGLDGLVLLR